MSQFRIVLLASALSLTASAEPSTAATASEPCNAQEFRQFDFWLGDWDVASTASGVARGTSHISREIGGCVIWENWTSSGSGYFGKSYNTYNVSLQRWEQYWVDNQGGVIFFYGGLKNSTMDY